MVSAVSFITELPCDFGLRYDVDIYCGMDLPMMQQQDLILQHLLKSIVYLSEQEKYPDSTMVAVVVYFPLSVDGQYVHKLIQQIFPDWKQGPWKHTQYFAQSTKNLFDGKKSAL